MTDRNRTARSITNLASLLKTDDHAHEALEIAFMIADVPQSLCAPLLDAVHDEDPAAITRAAKVISTKYPSLWCVETFSVDVVQFGANPVIWSRVRYFGVPLSLEQASQFCTNPTELLGETTTAYALEGFRLGDQEAADKVLRRLVGEELGPEAAARITVELREAPHDECPSWIVIGSLGNDDRRGEILFYADLDVSKIRLDLLSRLDDLKALVAP